jgi:uncharacterized membrane protein
MKNGLQGLLTVTGLQMGYRMKLIPINHLSAGASIFLLLFGKEAYKKAFFSALNGLFWRLLLMKL